MTNDELLAQLENIGKQVKGQEELLAKWKDEMGQARKDVSQVVEAAKKIAEATPILDSLKKQQEDAKTLLDTLKKIADDSSRSSGKDREPTGQTLEQLRASLSAEAKSWANEKWAAMEPDLKEAAQKDPALMRELLEAAKQATESAAGSALFPDVAGAGTGSGSDLKDRLKKVLTGAEGSGLPPTMRVAASRVIPGLPGSKVLRVTQEQDGRYPSSGQLPPSVHLVAPPK